MSTLTALDIDVLSEEPEDSISNWSTHSRVVLFLAIFIFVIGICEGLGFLDFLRCLTPTL